MRTHDRQQSILSGQPLAMASRANPFLPQLPEKVHMQSLAPTYSFARFNIPRHTYIVSTNALAHTRTHMHMQLYIYMLADFARHTRLARSNYILCTGLFGSDRKDRKKKKYRIMTTPSGPLPREPRGRSIVKAGAEPT